MDYNTLINETRNKLDNYVFDDSKYDEIYNDAYKSLMKSYSASNTALENSYRQSQKKAVGENALSAKSLYEDLAKRGLARSGESALLKINSGIALNNSLAELESSNLQARSELADKKQDALYELQNEIAQKKANAMEEEKAELYDRLEHLENLKANDEKWRAKLYSQSANSAVQSNVSADTESTDESEDSKSDSIIKRALKPLLNFASKVTSNSTVGEKYTPVISASNMAKNITKRYANNYGYLSQADQSEVMRDFAMLIATSNLAEDYATDMLAVLRSLGFTKPFSIKSASKQYMKTAFEKYEKALNEKYYELLGEGYTKDDASKNAKDAAAQAAYNVLNMYNLSDTEYLYAEQMLGLKY